MKGSVQVDHPPDVTLCECALDTDDDMALDEAVGLLDRAELAKAASFVFTRDRDRYVRAHGHVRRRLGAALNMRPQDVPIAVEAGGKPYVEGRAVDFSLSHSGSRAVLAIMPGGEVGIDLEVLDSARGLDEQLEGLSETCLTAPERQALFSTPRAQRSRRFLSYWTAKEARMKLTGEGMALDPLDIALDLNGGRPVGYLRPQAPGAALRFITLSDPGAICCLAIKA